MGTRASLLAQGSSGSGGEDPTAKVSRVDSDRTPGQNRRVELAGLILGVLGAVLAVLSIWLVFAVERARAARIVIEPGHRYWSSSSPFAHIAIINPRPAGWLGRRFRGVTATNCRVSLEFLRSSVTILGPIDARWSQAAEPRDGRDIADSFRWDLAATGQPEQVAIARTQDGVAHAFSAESYAHHWQKPDWLLEPAEYDVVIRVSATEAEATRTVRLVVGTRGELWLGEPAASG